MHKISTQKRVSTLHDYQILDSLPEEAFDNISRIASYICETPISLITFIEEDRQFYKSVHGTTVNITSIENSICYQVLQQSHDILIIEDTRKEDGYKDNPYVKGAPYVVFYAGVLLRTPEGVPIGTLCVVDHSPKSLTKNQADALKALAHQIIQLLELRKAHIESNQNKKILEGNSRRLDNLIKATQAGTWEWNVQTGEMKINDRWAEILGYTLEELEPINLETWYKLTHPDDAKRSDEIINQCFEGKVEFYDHECRMYHKDGHLVWVHDRGKVVEWSPEGEPLMMMGTHTDITKKKTSEIQLQAIADNIPGVVFRYLRTEGTHDQLLQISKGSLDIWGYSARQVSEDNFQVWNRIHIEDLPLLLDSIEASAKNESFWTHEWRYLHPDGTERWHKGSGKPTKLSTGQIIWDCVTLDITERKRIQQKLTLSEQRFKALVQEGSDLITIIDTKGKYQYVSPTSKKIMGYDADYLVGKNANDFIHPDAREAVEKQFKLLKTQKQVYIQPYRYKNNDGEWAWLETIATNLLKDPAIEGIVTNSRDVTEKEKTFRALKASEDRYKGFYESQTNFVVRTDMEGKYTYVNKKFIEDFGWLYPDGKILGKNSLTSILEYDHQKVIQVVEKCANAIGSLYKVEIDKPTETGGFVTTLWDFVCIGNDTGKPSEIQCVGIDITERIQFERELIKSNERFSIVNKATKDAIYDWDVVQDSFFWGEGFERMFGYKSQDTKEYKLADWIQMTHPTDEQENQERWETFFNDPNQPRWVNEFRFLKADGQYSYVKEIGFMLRDKKGTPERMIGVLRDITEQKVSEIQTRVELEIANLFKEGNKKLEETLQDTLRYLTDFAGFETAEIWLSSTDQKHLNLNSCYQENKLAQTFYNASKEVKRVKKGEGLPGAVWEKKSIVLWDEIDKKKVFKRREAASKVGLKSAVGIPLVHNRNIVGVLVLGSTSFASAKEEFLRFFEPIKKYLGAEIKRKQQEEEIHSFFDNAPQILAIAGPDGHFTKVNPAFCELLGYTREELTSIPFETFIHPDDINSTMDEYSESLKGDRLVDNFINRYRTKEGDYRYISWSSSEIFGEDGFYYAYGKDITKVIELQRLFESTAKMANIGSWELDLRDSELNENMFWSEMAREIMEVDATYNPSLSGGMEFFVGEYKRKISEAVQKLINTGEPFDLELLLLTAKGNFKWVRAIGQADFVSGICEKIYGSYQDIHQRKEAELNVKDALQERDIILESIGDAFFAVDHDWHVTYWNKQAEELLQTKKETILRKKLWDVFASHVGQKSHQQYTRAMNFAETVHFEDYYPDTDRWFEITAYPSKSGLSVYFKDVSIRKIAEEQIRLSNERFEKITEATQDAIWDYDVQNNKLFWGKGFLKLFGHDPEEKEPTYEFLIEMIHPEDRGAVVSKMERYMSDPSVEHWQEEYRFQKGDGTYTRVIDRALFIRDKQNVVTRALGAMTDISYRNNAAG